MSDETAIYLRVRGEIIRVNGRSAVVGRSHTCDVQLDVHGVSRRHCEVIIVDDGVAIRDLGSTHGTWIDRRRIVAEERPAAGAIVSLGHHGPHFEVVDAVVDGRSLLGVAPPPRAAPAPTPPAPQPSKFLVGLAWGVLAGVVAGVAVLALVDLRF